MELMDMCRQFDTWLASRTLSNDIVYWLVMLLSNGVFLNMSGGELFLCILVSIINIIFVTFFNFMLL